MHKDTNVTLYQEGTYQGRQDKPNRFYRFDDSRYVALSTFEISGHSKNQSDSINYNVKCRHLKPPFSALTFSSYNESLIPLLANARLCPVVAKLRVFWLPFVC